MILIKEMKEQHSDILRLADTLLTRMQDNSLRDTRKTQELFEQLADLVNEHFELEERTLYAELINHKDQEIKNTTWRFLGGAPRLKKYFNGYVEHCRRWEAGEEDVDAFLKETEKVFALLKERISVENRVFYSLVEKLQGAIS